MARIRGLAAVCIVLGAASGAVAQQASLPEVTARDMYAGCAGFVEGAPLEDSGGPTKAALCRNAALSLVRSEGAENASPYKFCMPAEAKADGDALKDVGRMYLEWYDANEGRAHLGKPVPEENGYAMLTAATLVSWPCG